MEVPTCDGGAELGMTVTLCSARHEMRIVGGPSFSLLEATSEELIHLEHIPVLVSEAPQPGKWFDPWAFGSPFPSLLGC